MSDHLALPLCHVKNEKEHGENEFAAAVHFFFSVKAQGQVRENYFLNIYIYGIDYRYLLLLEK